MPDSEQNMDEQFRLPALRRRRGQTMTPEERAATKEAFLKVFANTANIRAACLQVGIDRSLIVEWKKTDEEFAAQFDEANEAANWLLFGEAWRRAMTGDKEYVVSLGKLVYDQDGKPLTVQKRSDRLLELMLKARMPEFRDRGTTIVNILPKEYINLPEDDGIESEPGDPGRNA